MPIGVSRTSPRRLLAALDRNVAQEILYEVLDAIAPPEDDTEENQKTRNIATLAILDSFQPRNTMEALVCSHILVSHHAAMHSYRTAMEIDPRSPVHSCARNIAAGQSRIFFQSLAMLQRLQAGSAKPATAENPTTAPDVSAQPAAKRASSAKILRMPLRNREQAARKPTRTLSTPVETPTPEAQ